MPTIGIDACLTTTPHWYDKCSEKCGRTLSCYSVALCCCTNGRTWACMISSRYLMPVSVPSTTTLAVLPRDEMPPHTMTLPPPYGRRSITQLVMETFTNKTVYSGTAVAVVETKPGLIREKNTCPVLLREVYVSSTPSKPCYTMTLLQNRTYGRTSWTYASFTQSIT